MMNNEEDYSDDTEDEDYIPGKNSDEEPASEISDDNDDSENSNNEGEGNNDKDKSGKRKITKKSQQKSRKRKGGIILEADSSDKKTKDEESTENKNVEDPQQEERDKERANMLWQDFLKDSKVTPKRTELAEVTSTVSTTPKETNKLTVTNEYNFAGEVIKVTGVADSKSKAVKSVGSINDRIEKVESPCSTTQTDSPITAKKLSGLDSVLNRISGLKKMSTLEKSRLDWNIFKEDEGISEDLKTHNRGKNGFLEKQAFLQRTDERQFDIEKSFRSNRSNR